MKKKKPLPPRHKRMNQQSRLQAAKHWIPKYEGKNIVRGYWRHFGVSPVGAALELRMLGMEVSDEYIAKLRADEEARRKANERRKQLKKEREQMDMYPDSDETFCFIAGYTSNGVPFGITWEEHEREEDNEFDDIFND
jgi:hypothetical protein